MWVHFKLSLSRLKSVSKIAALCLSCQLGKKCSGQRVPLSHFERGAINSGPGALLSRAEMGLGD